MTSFMDRLKARMDAATGTQYARNPNYKPQEPPKRHRSLVQTNRWDKKVWGTARVTQTVDELIEDLAIGDEHRGGERKGFDPAPELTEGLFQTFFKAAPELSPKRELERDVYAARRILEEMQENPQLKDLQEMTAGDAVMSTVALDSMGDTVREILQRVGDMPDPNQQGQGGGGGGGQGQGQGQGQGGGSGGGQGDGEHEDEDLTSGENGTAEWDPDAEDAENQEEADWQAAMDEALDGLDLDRLANAALEAATAEIEEIDSARKGIGLEDGEWKTMSPEERIAMADRLRTEEMKELAAVIGQMRHFALGVKAQRIVDVPHEAYDVETGNDLRRILRPQLGLLATKETSYEFYRRFVDKELLVYKMRGQEEVGKGPIVLAIDKSGSMGGAPFRWAMGVAEALRRFAAEEDRDYYAMFFGNNNDRERFDFPEGKGPFDKVLAFLGTVANGGTQFDGVLTEALEKASKSFNDEGKGKADIVFITDGMAHLDEDWIKNFNAERERVGVRVYSVYIGGSYDYGHTGGPLGLLEKISDACIPVAELNPQSVKQVFERV
jgi:uncharacterized protein with von Willebrand factor type A (vWA) domain